MYTYLEVLQGPEKGRVFKIKPHMRLGSGPYEIQLADPTIPDCHSQFLLDQQDKLVLVCNNAIYEIYYENRVVKKLTLNNDSLFHIGNTQFRVFIDAIDRPNTSQRDFTKGPHNSVLSGNHDTPIKRSPELKEQLLQELKALSDKSSAKTSIPLFRLFKQPLKLKVLSGPQTDDEFFLSWGPREFGPGALEFPLEFPPWPSILFTLAPDPQGEIIYTSKDLKASSVIGKENFPCILNHGDQIIAGTSVVIIEFVKDF